MDSVLLLRAGDYEAAFQRALALGRAREESYLNGDGQRVVWRLVEVISLDQLGSQIEEGMEVYSEPVELPKGASIAFGAEFAPEASRPTQTV
jgi:hypothetical protein